MYYYSPSEVQDRVPEELRIALEQAILFYEQAKLYFENKIKENNSIEEAGQMANEAWLQYRKVNEAVAEYIKKRYIRKDVMETIVQTYNIPSTMH
jgi:predicted RNase H-like HicB family nuclease